MTWDQNTSLVISILAAMMTLGGVIYAARMRSGPESMSALAVAMNAMGAENKRLSDKIQELGDRQTELEELLRKCKEDMKEQIIGYERKVDELYAMLGRKLVIEAQ